MKAAVTKQKRGLVRHTGRLHVLCKIPHSRELASAGAAAGAGELKVILSHVSLRVSFVLS